MQRTVIFKRRKRLDPFLQDPNRVIDYKDVALLSKYLSERGKILGRKFTGLNAYNQRKVSKAIKRAQGLGLIPYTTISSR
ncbi:MAG TPA: 30S ribosomal protein S18 [Oligoflexia bacterium]|nr:30S ribosomal protein S18 [Oligoflexia bacterium]HMP26790.1 30S ribosomal protein S18 [Oligoflexia bacterium]